ncbi:hypothetical protein LJC40_06500 [Synergistaceae bacterium OttesenSCG-928-D05]|nr:hypothetical protein [Synergistaceae bacterium OttesenSCG-928-D05]
MLSFKCPDCKAKVSTDADSCLKCGRQITDVEKKDAMTKHRKSWYKKWWGKLALFVITLFSMTIVIGVIAVLHEDAIGQRVKLSPQATEEQLALAAQRYADAMAARKELDFVAASASFGDTADSYEKVADSYYYAEKKYEDAAAMYEKAQEALSKRKAVLPYESQEERAVVERREIVTLGRKKSYAYTSAANLLNEAGEYEKAAESYHNAYLSYPSYSDIIRLQKGSEYTKEEEEKIETEWQNKRIDMRLQTASMYEKAADIYFNTKDYGKAGDMYINAAYNKYNAAISQEYLLFFKKEEKEKARNKNKLILEELHEKAAMAFSHAEDVQKKASAYKSLGSRLERAEDKNAASGAYKTAIALYEDAIRNGHKYSNEMKYTLTEYYKKGLGVPKDEARVVQLLTEAANAGYDRAFISLAEMYRTGDGVRKSEEMYFRIMQEAMARGYPSAFEAMGGYYFTSYVLEHYENGWSNRAHLYLEKSKAYYTEAKARGSKSPVVQWRLDDLTTLADYNETMDSLTEAYERHRSEANQKYQGKIVYVRDVRLMTMTKDKSGDVYAIFKSTEADAPSSAITIRFYFSDEKEIEKLLDAGIGSSNCRPQGIVETYDNNILSFRNCRVK